MKAQDIFTHIDRLGVAGRRANNAAMFRLSVRGILYLYDDESWTLKTLNTTECTWTFDILNSEVMNAVAMTDQELLNQIEEEIMKGKLEAM